MAYYLSLKSKMRGHKERSNTYGKKTVLGIKSKKTGKKRLKVTGLSA